MTGKDVLIKVYIQLSFYLTLQSCRRLFLHFVIVEILLQSIISDVMI